MKNLRDEIKDIKLLMNFQNSWMFHCLRKDEHAEELFNRANILRFQFQSLYYQINGHIIHLNQTGGKSNRRLRKNKLHIRKSKNSKIVKSKSKVRKSHKKRNVHKK